MSKNGWKDHDRHIADQFIAALENGTAPWQKPWKAGEPHPFGGIPYNPTTGKEYRGGNVGWLMLRQMHLGSTDSRWMTYKQALAEGAQVRKGEKSTKIEYWKRSIVMPKGATEGDDQDADEAKGKPRLTRFPARVFNACQIDGLPPPEPRPEVPEAFRHAEVERVMERLGVPVQHGGNQAFYMQALDRIQMPKQSQFLEESGYWATLLHEGGHATGHPSRLNRDLSGGKGSESYAREELRAEIFSMMAGNALQLGHDPGQHHAYVASWIRILKDDPREIYRAASDAQKMMDFLGIEKPKPEAVHAQERKAAFVREFDLVLQRDYFISLEDAGLDEAEVLTYLDAGSAQDAVAEYASEYDLDPRGPLDPKPSPELLQELERLRSQRDRLAGALRETLNEPEPEPGRKPAVKP